MPVHLIQIEIANRFAGGGVLGLLHGFFELLGENIFLMRFLKERVGELVFALAMLFGKNPVRIFEVNVRPGFDWSFVRKHCSEHRVDDKLRLATRAGHV